MDGRNNKLKDQKGLDQKGSGRQRNPPKEILPRVKRTISKAYGWTKIYIHILVLVKFTVWGIKLLESTRKFSDST